MNDKTKDALDIEIIKLYQSGLSMKAVGEEIGKNQATVFNRLKKHNVKTRTRGGIYEIPIEDICEDYYGKNISPEDISKKHGVCMQTIYNYLHSNEKRIKGMSEYHNPNMNHRYFKEIDTERKAYFLGFIIADGNVSTRVSSSPCISIAIQSRDVPILHTLKEELRTDNKVCHVKNETRDEVSLSVHSKEMAEDLAKYGVVPRKTHTSYLPTNVPREFMPHLIRGLIDGDGWVQNPKSGVKWGFCGNKRVVTQVRDFLSEEINVYNVKVLERERDSTCSINYGGVKNSKLIADYMYEGATVYLERKYERFKEFIST